MIVTLRRAGPGLSVLATILALVAVATSFASNKLGVPAVGIDDANIFFVYARNVSAGEGFVFNPGGERVEGFTSLLWVLVCTAAVRLTPAAEQLLLLVNVVLVTLTLAYCLRSSVLKPGKMAGSLSQMWAIAFLTMLLLDFRYVAWSTVTLMETALWGALLSASTVLVVDAGSSRRYAWRLVGLVVLLVMTRPEALVWVPLMCGLFYISRIASGTLSRDAVRSVIPSVLAYVLTAISLTVFRFLYFGVPLPNTFYAKVSPSLAFNLTEGMKYLGQYLSSGALQMGSTAALVISTAHLVRVRGRDTRTLGLVVAALWGLTIPVLTGGDHFDGFRFYQPIYPILLLMLLNCLRFILLPYLKAARHGSMGHPRSLAAAAALLAAVVTVQVVDWMQVNSKPLATEFVIAAAGRNLGKAANRLFEGLHPYPEIGTISVGGLKYAYAGHVVDLMGLNNTKMAHNRGTRIGVRSHSAFEKRTFYELTPQVVVPLVQHGSALSEAAEPAPFVDTVLKGLLRDKQFLETYQLAEVRRNSGDAASAVAGWYNKRFLADLSRLGAFDIRIADERE